LYWFVRARLYPKINPRTYNLSRFAERVVRQSSRSQTFRIAPPVRIPARPPRASSSPRAPIVVRARARPSSPSSAPNLRARARSPPFRRSRTRARYPSIVRRRVRPRARVARVPSASTSRDRSPNPRSRRVVPRRAPRARAPSRAVASRAARSKISRAPRRFTLGHGRSPRACERRRARDAAPGRRATTCAVTDGVSYFTRVAYG